MHLVSTDNLSSGDVIGRSIYDGHELLLAAGYKIDKKMIRKLLSRRQNYVYVMDGVVDDLVPEEVISETLRQSANMTVETALKEIENNKQLGSLKPENIKERLHDDPKLKNLIKLSAFRDMANDLLDEIIANNIILLTALPTRSDSARQFQHAVDTTLLCILMGQAMEMLMDDIRALATSALLHDIGKAVLREEHVTMNPTEQHELETLLMEHPTYSMLIVKGSDPASYREQHTVQQHHEQLDGSGYPLGLQGENIPPVKRLSTDKGGIFRHAMILAVANHYDNLVTGMHDGVTHTPEKAMVKIIDEAGKIWNSHSVQALVKIVQLYPVGTMVRFLRSEHHEYSGQYGVVVKTNRRTPLKPVIVLTHNALRKKIPPVKVNCATDRMLKLELVL